MNTETKRHAGYHLPEDAYNALQELRTKLHLLASLALPEKQQPDDILVPRMSLSGCFTELAHKSDLACLGIELEGEEGRTFARVPH